jgi:hypothetical protein
MPGLVPNILYIYELFILMATQRQLLMLSLMRKSGQGQGPTRLVQGVGIWAKRSSIRMCYGRVRKGSRWRNDFPIEDCI